MKLGLNVLILVVVSGTFSVVGCGQKEPETYVVSGSVTLDDKPLPNGRINLIPSDGKGAAVGGEIKDGDYEVRIASGPKIVEITSEKVTGKQKAYPGDPMSPEFDIKEQIIPPKYNSNTELKVTVEEGPTEADFDLLSNPPAKK